MVRIFARSAGHAWRGMVFSWREGRNFRIQAVIALVVLVLALLADFSPPEVSLLVVACALVLSAELLNTLIEELLDIIEPRASEHVKRLKDLAAGLVLLLCGGAVLIGILTVLSHFGT